MRILWFSPFLLQPATQGGQIRSLGILKWLNRRHEVRFVSMQLDGQEDGVASVGEYCGSSRLIRHSLPRRGGMEFAVQLLMNLVSELPLTIERDISPDFRAAAGEEMAKGWHDVAVCDFLSLAVNTARLDEMVLFQHNVETVIWERMAQRASNPAARAYLNRQARRMAEFEKRQCLAARQVVAVSETDEGMMRERFGATRVSTIPTGVDLERNYPQPDHAAGAELVFVGSLDWGPNLDGLRWFAAEVLPGVRQAHSGCRLAIVGKNPGAEAESIGRLAPGISIHGNVADVRPYLWGAKAAIVPLHAGGGTRLKIYEAMGAGVAQVSTTIGAEGLEVRDGVDIMLADTADAFKQACLRLLKEDDFRQRMAGEAGRVVREKFGMESVAEVFEQILEQARR
ncbi:MAG: hypothetical protein C0504_09410 [Candidatus Solibacter sp.]|nr:hypothetical protein [Candidatus Solibacter sp.]